MLLTIQLLLSTVQRQIKLSLLSSIHTFKDPLIMKISGLVLDQNHSRCENMPSEAGQTLNLAKKFILSITTKTLSCNCISLHWENCVKYWNNKLGELTIQSKFSSITELESQKNIWKRIQKGLPARKLFPF